MTITILNIILWNKNYSCAAVMGHAVHKVVQYSFILSPKKTFCAYYGRMLIFRKWVKTIVNSPTIYQILTNCPPGVESVFLWCLSPINVTNQCHQSKQQEI